MKGWCLVLDANEGCLAFELANHTDLNFLCLERDTLKITRAREKLSRAGMYGKRITFVSWDLSTLPDYFANLVVSDDLAAGGSLPSESWSEIQRVVRPLGGTTFFGKSGIDKDLENKFDNWKNKINPGPEDKVIVSGQDGIWLQFTRGCLEGGGTWTHLYADCHNRAVSQDEELVRGPLGILWFGEPGERGMVDRHGRPMGPVSGYGRFFIQGEEKIMAYDAYNGTFLWERKIPGSTRVRVDVDAGNLALGKDGLYVAAKDKCIKLDPASGKTLKIYSMPPSPDGTYRRWGYIALVDNILLGTESTPLNDYAILWETWVDVENMRWREPEEIPENIRSRPFHPHRWWFQCRGDRRSNQDNVQTFEEVMSFYQQRYPVPNDLARRSMHHQFKLFEPMGDYPPWDPLIDLEDAVGEYLQTVSGDLLFAVDTETGETLWTRQGALIPNIAVVAGRGSVTFLERQLSDEDHRKAVKERLQLIRKGIYTEGMEKDVDPEDVDVRHVVSVDLQTGRERWSRHLEITGCGGEKTGIAYQDGKLVLLGHFNIKDLYSLYEQGILAWRRITVLDEDNGEVLWSRPLNYSHRPPIIEGNILAEPHMVRIADGEYMVRENPVTGEQEPFFLDRKGKNCSPIQGSRHMVFFRRADIELYNLENDGGISRMGAMRPSCWINMITANGLALFPEGASGCTCPYPVRTSFAMKHRENTSFEPWSVFTTNNESTVPVKHLSINFGAPGDMRDTDNTLWIGYPRPVGFSRSLDIPVELKVLDREDFTFNQDYRFLRIEGTDQPWLLSSGIKGLQKCTVLVSDGKPVNYIITLGWVTTRDEPGHVKFQLKINGKTVEKDFNPFNGVGKAPAFAVKEYHVLIDRELTIEIIPRPAGNEIEDYPRLASMQIMRTPETTPDSR
jgi:outer membrane protein assembly factor BamB